jgi:hypothetical protein
LDVPWSDAWRIRINTSYAVSINGGVTEKNNREKKGTIIKSHFLNCGERGGGLQK